VYKNGAGTRASALKKKGAQHARKCFAGLCQALILLPVNLEVLGGVEIRAWHSGTSVTLTMTLDKEVATGVKRSS
jgi:hypothetical protein